MFSSIAVHTQDLVAFRKILFAYVLVEAGSVARVQLCLTLNISVVMNMVNSQKHRFSFTAAGTFVPAIRSKDLIFALTMQRFGFFRFRCTQSGNLFWRSFSDLFVTPLTRLLTGFVPVCLRQSRIRWLTVSRFRSRYRAAASRLFALCC